MTELTETLERRITIAARPETIFRFFTDPDRFARWWGEGSRIEGRPGGEVLIKFPGGGNSVDGKILEIEPPRRVVFTYRFAGGIESLVTITLEPGAGGTALHLHHAFSSAKIRDQHVQGWRYQLALFSKAIAEEGAAVAGERVDAWLRAWGDPDAAERRRLVESCTTAGVVFRDAYSATEGQADLLAHLDAVQMFFPGVHLHREGDVRLSHGTAAAKWVARRDGAEPLGHGLNVFELSPDGQIAKVVGFWEK
jgi:uncharacterized protein YndB with AHSA1/START domain